MCSSLAIFVAHRCRMRCSSTYLFWVGGAVCVANSVVCNSSLDNSFYGVFHLSSVFCFQGFACCWMFRPICMYLVFRNVNFSFICCCLCVWVEDYIFCWCIEFLVCCCLFMFFFYVLFFYFIFVRVFSLYFFFFLLFLG